MIISANSALPVLKRYPAGRSGAPTVVLLVLDVPIQSRRDKKAAKRLLRKLRRKQGRAPRVMITDKLKSYAAAKKDLKLLL